jgi:hypothetical protein
MVAGESPARDVLVSLNRGGADANSGGKVNIVHEIVEAFEISENKPKRITLGVEAASDVKTSPEMLKYGLVAPTRIEFLGMEFVVDSSLPENEWILK